MKYRQNMETPLKKLYPPALARAQARFDAAMASEPTTGEELVEVLEATSALYLAHGRPLAVKGILMWLKYETWTTTN